MFYLFLNLGHIWQHKILFQTAVRLHRNRSFYSQALSGALSSDANTYGKTYTYYSLFLPNAKLPGIITIIIEDFLLRTSEVVSFCMFKNSVIFWKNFDVLLTVHFSIILATDQLNEKILFFLSILYSSTCFEHCCAHYQKVKTVLHSIWYRHTL